MRNKQITPNPKALFYRAVFAAFPSYVKHK